MKLIQSFIDAHPYISAAGVGVLLLSLGIASIVSYAGGAVIAGFTIPLGVGIIILTVAANENA